MALEQFRGHPECRQHIAAVSISTEPTFPRCPRRYGAGAILWVNLEVKKPAGKWEKVSGAAYGKIQPDPDTGLPLGLGLDTIPGFTMLMQENKDRMVFVRMTGSPKS